MKSAFWCPVVVTAVLFANDLPAIGQQKQHPKEFTNSLGMKFVWIPAGTFLMGSLKQEEGREDEETRHKVTLTKGFYIGVYTVTQEQWQSVMGTNPSFHKGEKNLPVEMVSWDDCQEFLTKLRKKDGRLYRLPTEAEWEYSCRAGTTTAFHFGDNIASHTHANFNGNLPYGKEKGGLYLRKTTPVGSYPSNGWGLHDMHGNVWQWCADWFETLPQESVVDPQSPVEVPSQVPELIKKLSSPVFKERQAANQALKKVGLPALSSLKAVAKDPPDLETRRRVEQLIAFFTNKGACRVLRGGSYSSPAALVRSANRSGLDPSSRSADVSLRVVSTLE
jgi:formylglycine-generating enzyme required for sulfatase activity